MSDTPVLVGVAGWSYDDWKGVVYPAGEKDKLRYLADYLDCIEINSSFYRPFSAGTAEKWVSSVSGNERFRFTAKAWSRLTHERQPPYTAEDREAFNEGLRPLSEAGRLMAVLLQFPFFFVNTPPNRDHLARLAQDFAEYPMALEVRDSSWDTPEALDFIRGIGLNIACLDMPISRNAFSAHAVVTGDIAYLRLHGRNSREWFRMGAERNDKYNYLYGEDELTGILERVEKLRDVAAAVVAVWNNHYRGKAAVNAFQTLNALLREKVRIPALLQDAYPQLVLIAKPAPGMLF